MNFAQAASDESVIDALQSIENKLYERGVLVTVTGDAGSDVTIAFKEVLHQGESVPALVIAISVNESALLDEPDWEGLSDYVNEEFRHLRAGIRTDALAALQESCGQYVTLNGRVVY
jgi:hypothetical protein